MSGNKSKPSETGAEKAEISKEEIKAEEVNEGAKNKDSFSSKVTKYMNRSASKKKSRNIDPIIAVSATVLILCCAIVIGYTIYDKCFADHTQPNVEYGDTVNVEYVGSFYCYYDEDGSVIFDTNIEDVSKSDKYKHSYEYGSGSEAFEVYEVTVGSRGALAMFEDALIGHHPGETVKVYIPADQGYELKGGKHNGNISGNVIDSKRIFYTYDSFESFFGVAPLDSGVNTIVSPYGWDATYVKNADSTYTVTYSVTAADVGKTFTKEGSDVSYKVTAYDTTSGEITYDLVFEWKEKMLMTFDSYGNTIYITNYNANTGIYEYKIKTGTTSSDDREVSGENLYFVIKIVGYPE